MSSHLSDLLIGSNSLLCSNRAEQMSFVAKPYDVIIGSRSRDPRSRCSHDNAVAEKSHATPRERDDKLTQLQPYRTRCLSTGVSSLRCKTRAQLSQRKGVSL